MIAPWRGGLWGGFMKLRVLVHSALSGALLLGATCIAHASPYMVTLEEVGTNVVATGSGQIDLTNLLLTAGNIISLSGIGPSSGTILTGPAGLNLTDIYGFISGPR